MKRIVAKEIHQLRRMSSLTLQSKLKLASGNEMPQLGFGVSRDLLYVSCLMLETLLLTTVGLSNVSGD